MLKVQNYIASPLWFYNIFSGPHAQPSALYTSFLLRSLGHCGSSASDTHSECHCVPVGLGFWSLRCGTPVSALLLSCFTTNFHKIVTSPNKIMVFQMLFLIIKFFLQKQSYLEVCFIKQRFFKKPLISVCVEQRWWETHVFPRPCMHTHARVHMPIHPCPCAHAYTCMCAQNLSWEPDTLFIEDTLTRGLPP